MKRYAIPYKGLSIGNHHFEFEVDDRFFDAFEGSEIHRGHASVSVELVKTERLLTLDFTIDGEVEVTCDRCLDEFMMPVHYAGTLQVRFSETEKESDGEVMWLSPNETELPLGQYIYESISLSLPYRKIHPEDAEGHSLRMSEGNVIVGQHTSLPVGFRAAAADGRWLVTTGKDETTNRENYALVEPEQFMAGSAEQETVTMWQG